MTSRAGRALRFRRSPHLVSYFDDGQFVVHNYIAGTSIPANALAVTILACCDDWRSPEKIAKSCPSSPSAVARALTRLAGSGMLDRSDRRSARGTRAALADWSTWNPAAGFFHFSTRDVAANIDLAATEREIRRETGNRPQPPAAKRYRGAPQIPLPPPQTDEHFTPVLLGRRTWRRFDSRPIALTDLATLLGLTFRIQRTRKASDGSRVIYKTSPSGGARHPYEAYVLALRVSDLPRGLYHYAADTHRLEVLTRGSSRRQVARYIPAQWWYQSAAAIVFMTAVFPRVQWRYRFPRAYRSVLLEAGHICQTFCLVATWLRLAPFCTHRIMDSRLEHDLGIDGIGESFIYAAGVGTRPPGKKVGRWPEHRRGNIFLPPERPRGRR